MKKKKRIVSQDIAKGIAILLVIMTHTVQVSKTIGSVIAVLLGYVMPFFLFMAGYNYNDKGLSVKENLKRRTSQILNPFLIYSFIIFIIMGIYFLLRHEATVYELVQSYFVLLLSKWGAKLIGIELPQRLYQRLLGPCWFLQFLIMADLIFIPFAKWVNNNKYRFWSSVALLSIVSALLIDLKVVLPWGIQNAPAIAALMLLANYIKQASILEKTSKKISWQIVNCLVCIGTIAYFQLKGAGAGFLGAGELGSVMGGVEVYVFYLMAFCGTYLLTNISKVIEKWKFPTKVLSWYGRNSLLILMVHICFMHVIKDIMGLEQRNAAESLFGTSTDPREIVALILTIIFVSGFVWLFNKYKENKNPEIQKA